MHNVGVDRHAAALRREAKAHLRRLRRNVAACPRRTTCYASYLVTCLRRPEVPSGSCVRSRVAFGQHHSAAFGLAPSPVTCAPTRPGAWQTGIEIARCAHGPRSRARKRPASFRPSFAAQTPAIRLPSRAWTHTRAIALRSGFTLRGHDGSPSTSRR